MTHPDTPTPTAPRRVEMHRGQLRFAERLAHSHGERLRYAHGVGWHVWDGMRWAPDLDDFPRRAVVESLKSALRELSDVDDPASRKELFDDIRKCESASGIEGVLKISSALQPLSVPAASLDRDPWLFNCQNGTLDLGNGQLKPHDPTDLITKVAGCGLDRTAIGDEFQRFIREILPDDEVRRFVQRLFGSAMSGRVRDHVMPIFTGTGKNGKSTLVELVRDTFGDYALAAEPELLLQGQYGHPTGQADLMGIRLATMEETDEGRSLAAATVKRLTGGTKIRARRMRENFFEFPPSHTLIMVTNKLPLVKGDDPAIWRRILAVPFDVVVPDAEIDLRLPERLRLEMPAVLAWLVDGFVDWGTGGLAPPDRVRARTEEYHTASDPYKSFLEDKDVLDLNVNAATSAREMFSAWARWSKAHDEPTGSEVSFAAAMARLGVEKKRTTAGNVYMGVMLYSGAGEDQMM